MEHEQTQRGLSLTFCLTRDVVRRPQDFARRIDTEIAREVVHRLGREPVVSYVCGRNAFVDVVATALVETGVDASRIRTERYGGS